VTRLTRAQQQERTRAAVLAAARAEFAEHGYAEAKVDRIAERAELTRGAIYSNFPSKRSLYLAVLLNDTTPVDGAERRETLDLAAAAEAFARVRLERLPLTADEPAAGRLRARSLTGVADDERGRATLVQLTKLEAALLAVALESCGARNARRPAELILTLLHGAAHLAETAPGFGDPFDVARACRHLTALDLTDAGDPPHLPYVPAARPVREPWNPPGDMIDELSGRPTGFDADGILAVLGVDRLEAAEEAIRAARPHDVVTVVLATDDPDLVRLRVTDLTASLRRVFGPAIRPSLRLVLDDHGAFGTPTTQETAVRLEAGQIVARADGRGAAYAVAIAGRRG